MPSLKDFIKKNPIFVVIILTLYFMSALTVIFTPKGFAIPELQNSYFLFGPSFAALVILLGIGSYLIYRYFNKSPPRNESLYQLIWGVSFIIYSLTFVGLCLQALGLEIANMSEPLYFLVWRSPMIFWVSGMWIGTMKLFTEDKTLVYVPALLGFVIGELWFFLRLIVLQDLSASIAIEQTMYAFLFGGFIPMAVVIAYMFFTYGRDLNLSSAKMLGVGFTLLAVTYAAWAPWHFTDLKYIYLIWFNIFNVSLAIIFAGFFALPKETTAKAIS